MIRYELTLPRKEIISRENVTELGFDFSNSLKIKSNGRAGRLKNDFVIVFNSTYLSISYRYLLLPLDFSFIS